MSKENELDQVYGKNLRGLSKKLSHDMPLLKMLPICATSVLTRLSKICGRSGMHVNGILYQLAPLVPVTSEREFGLLHTLKAQGGKPRTLPTPTCRDSGGPLPPRKHHSGGGQKPPLVSVMCSEKSMRLNPLFVEAMMGYPKDWTNVEEESESSN